ncbi:uncharacterized protein THITE_51646 [Thermothielavioides terrestris NRRL 8126]|uniref:Domain of unknown function at the cortex 1 domain-containing protein n=1 Tax=Thermothielavioides terrestris (strain ATCC 38088 / NRRL 8126) TaxID=578455 RepID=G2R8B7_THETT|nr:uncharacterized protein THITE_51646 [Thermothielavioides terrestris NRRL 8126]AEO68175.1 hypothetical protein THITE_51646 [Thermothielavioides terrestris NRRL 8126]
MAEKYLIRVTAGPGYDVASHVEVPVNSPAVVRVASALVDAELNVRVQNYRGLPRGAPPSSPYFAMEPHAGNGDQYSVAVRFRLRAPPEGEQGQNDVDDDESEGEGAQQPAGVSGTDLQFGNDFDHPIRDRLPPGFGTAMNIVKWWIDPGLEGDPYADMPYLYGPALSSFNTVHVGEGEHDEAKGGLWFDEGGDEAGMAWRRALGVPDDARARMKWALKVENKERWVWEYGRTYGLDFFNPYIDFNEFALRLPGFNLPIMRYWDGQGLRHHRKRSHQLRYVLRNRSTGQVYLVVLFTLHLAEDINEDGTLKPAAWEALIRASGGKGFKEAELPVPEPELELEPETEDFEDEEAIAEARRNLSRINLNGETWTQDDDVD